MILRKFISDPSILQNNALSKETSGKDPYMIKTPINLLDNHLVARSLYASTIADITIAIFSFVLSKNEHDK